MKNYGFIATLVLICRGIFAQTFPLEIELKTSKPHYIEGEKVEFILTMKNVDPVRGFNILVPQNRGEEKRIVELYWVVRTHYSPIFLFEDLDSSKTKKKNLTALKEVFLKPGQQIRIPIHWDDLEDSIYHRSKYIPDYGFNRPMFEGEYHFALRYNPRGSCANDTVFKYTEFSFTHDLDYPQEHFENGKLKVLEHGIYSNLCKVVIKGNPSGKFTIRGKNYRVLHKNNRSYYFLDLPRKVVYAGYSQKLNGKANVWSYKNKDNNLYFEFYPDGKLKEFRHFKDACNFVIEGYKFDEKGKLVYRTNTSHDWNSNTAFFFPDGRLNYQVAKWNNGMATRINYYYDSRGRYIKQTRVDFDPCK